MRKHRFYNFRPSILASKIHQRILFVQAPFLEVIVHIFYVFKNWSIWDPFKIQWAPKRDQQIDQVAKYWTNNYVALSDRIGKRKYMHKRQVDRSFVFSILFLFYLPTLAVQLSTSIWFVVLFGSAQCIGKHQADVPSEIQWHQKGSQTKNQEGPSVRRFSMYLASPTLPV